MILRLNCIDRYVNSVIFLAKVCSNMLDLFPNMCVFKKVMCMLDLEHVPLNTTTPCFDKSGGKRFYNRITSDIQRGKKTSLKSKLNVRNKYSLKSWETSLADSSRFCKIRNQQYFNWPNCTALVMKSVLLWQSQWPLTGPPGALAALPVSGGPRQGPVNQPATLTPSWLVNTL